MFFSFFSSIFSFLLFFSFYSVDISWSEQENNFDNNNVYKQYQRESSEGIDLPT